MNQKKMIILALVIFTLLSASLIAIVLLRNENSLHFSGIRIYDSIRKYNELTMNGFTVTPIIEGRDENGPVKLEATVVESNRGFMIIETNGTYRIVEGPLGKQDIRAKSITLQTDYPISLEMSHSEIDSLESFYNILEGTDRFKGEISFKTENNIDPILLQKIKNLNFVVYNTDNKFELTEFSNGVTINLATSVNSTEFKNLLEELDKNLEITEFLSGRVFVFVGVDDEEKIEEILSQKDYELFRVHKLR